MTDPRSNASDVPGRTILTLDQGSVASETEQLQMANNPDLSPLWTSFNISQMPTS